MITEHQSLFPIVTSSVEEGLDFAASLLTNGIKAQVQLNVKEASDLAIGFSQYIQFRYVGELGLAYEYLLDIGVSCTNNDYQRRHFFLQLDWVGQQMNFPALDIENLSIAQI
jgi:hypothetical protein